MKPLSIVHCSLSITLLLSCSSELERADFVAAIYSSSSVGADNISPSSSSLTESSSSSEAEPEFETTYFGTVPYKIMTISNLTWLAEDVNGELYTYEQAQSLCPTSDGWRLPNNEDLATLTENSGLPTQTNGLKTPDGLTLNAGTQSYWWSATENEENANEAWHINLNAGTAKIQTITKDHHLSVRCVKENQ